MPCKQSLLRRALRFLQGLTNSDCAHEYAVSSCACLALFSRDSLRNARNHQIARRLAELPGLKAMPFERDITPTGFCVV